MYDLPTRLTSHEKYGRALAITDQGEADRYFELLVADSMRHSRPRERAEQIERHMLLAWAGTHGEATKQRVAKLFKCEEASNART